MATTAVGLRGETLNLRNFNKGSRSKLTNSEKWCIQDFGSGDVKLIKSYLGGLKFQ